MPKMKTHSGAKKRVKRTRNGKSTTMFKVQKSCKNHLLTHKSKRQKHLHDNTGMILDSTLVRRVKKLILT
jgi:large subunit ribosomal protein L35